LENIWEKDERVIVTAEMPGFVLIVKTYTNNKGLKSNYILRHKRSYPGAMSQYLQRQDLALRLIWAIQ
jgi:hypothetical protein